MNKVCLTGRITKDIEIRYTQNNVAISNFTLAVTRNYKNADGTYETDFITCVAYNKTAELLSKYIKKGDLLGIEGRIQTRRYEDKDGKTIYITEINVDNMDFLQPKGNSTNKEEKPSEEPKKGISDDIFEEFGNSIEITEDEIAF